jgi:hypothetical protein
VRAAHRAWSAWRTRPPRKSERASGAHPTPRVGISTIAHNIRSPNPTIQMLQPNDARLPMQEPSLDPDAAETAPSESGRGSSSGTMPRFAQRKLLPSSATCRDCQADTRRRAESSQLSGNPAARTVSKASGRITFGGASENIGAICSGLYPANPQPIGVSSKLMFGCRRAWLRNSPT